MKYKYFISFSHVNIQEYGFGDLIFSTNKSSISQKEDFDQIRSVIKQSYDFEGDTIITILNVVRLPI